MLESKVIYINDVVLNDIMELDIPFNWKMQLIIPKCIANKREHNMIAVEITFNY